MEKKYDVKKFVYKYLESNDKENFIKERIVRTYLSFENKLTICEKIVDATCFDGERYSKDTSSANIFFELNLVNLYTDIAINFGEDFLRDYNLMEEYDVLSKIINAIPIVERRRFEDIFHNVMTDKEFNSCSNYAIYTSLKDLVGNISDALKDGFDSIDFNNIGNILTIQKE